MSPIVHDDVNLGIHQFSQASRLMCGGAPRSSIARGEDVDHVFSGVPIPFFNIALLTCRGISADRLTSGARDACAWASDKGVPWMFLLTHEALEPGIDATAVLADCDLVAMMPLTGML